MAVYLIYRTDFDNTIIREDPTNTASGGTEQSILKSLIVPPFLLPTTQPIYYWKVVLPTTVIPNSDTYIALWEAHIAPPPSPGALATVGYVNDVASELNSEIVYVSGQTDTKLNIITFTNYTGTTTLQKVTSLGATTSVESSFNGGLKLSKIRPTGDTTTAIQINKANGTTHIINIDTVSGYTGFGTIVPKSLIHAYGTDVSSGITQNNSIAIDGASNSDKEFAWLENGVPQWHAETNRNEDAEFWYLHNLESENSPLTVMRTGRIGINQQVNIMDYHTAEVVGSGLNDLIVSGIYTQDYNTVYEIQIVGVGTPDTWHWRKSVDNGTTYSSYSSTSGCTLTPVLLEFGVKLAFEHTTGHTIGNVFRFAAFTKIPQGTLILSPMGFREILTTQDYTADPIIYNDITSIANGGIYTNQFTLFNTGVTGTIQAFYWGTTVRIHSMYFNLLTFGSNLTLITEFWNGTSWTALNFNDNNYLDLTNNLSQSGRIIWTPNTMINWNKEYLPNLSGTAYQLYWMRVITTTNPTIAPIAQSISVGNDKRFAIYSSANDYRPSYYVDSLGRVDIGGGNITGSNVLQVNTANNLEIIPTVGATKSLVEIDSQDSAVVDLKIKLSSNDIIGGGLSFVKTRGTLDNPLGIVSGDTIGRIDFRGNINGIGEYLAQIDSIYTGDGNSQVADITFSTACGSNSRETVRFAANGNNGFGVITPTAVIHLKAGSTSIAPLKFTSGSLLSAPQIGAVEFLTDAYYGTITSGTCRKTFAFLESPQFTGTPNLPVGTTLNTINLCNYIWNSGGTNNACKLNTNIYAAYTASTQLALVTVITGVTNGICKYDCHNICLGGNLTSPVIICGDQDFCLQGKRIDFASSAGGQFYDKNGCSMEFYSSGGTVTIKGMTSGGSEQMRFQISNTQATFTDSRVAPRGVEYNGNYSASFTARSFVDKEYVDTHAGGLFPKASVVVATTAPVTLSGLTTIGGVQLITGMRVLVKNQASGATNGVYSASTGIWGRTSDFLSGDTQVVNGSYFFVTSGATNQNTAWILSTPNPIIVGTTSLLFTLFSAAVGVIAGNGICVTQSGGNYNIAAKLATDCAALCSDASGLYVNPSIAGTGLAYTNNTGVLSVCGANLAGNSLSWTGNSFNVDIATGTLSAALAAKLNISTFSSYTGTTLNNINSRVLTTDFNTYTGTTAPALYQLLSDFNIYTGTTAPNTYYNKTQINAYTGATQSAINLKAPIDSPTFTTFAKSVKPAQNDNTTCVATTSWYISQGGTTNALMDGVAGCGISNLFARQDHVHPSDTSRVVLTIYQTYTGTTAPLVFAPKASPIFTGVVTIPTPFTLGAVSVKTTGTELNYLTGTTSNIQAQINAKSPKASPIFTGVVTIPTPFTLGAVSVKTTGTELNYVTGVTSNIQTQLGTKAPIISPTFTVSARSVTPIANNNDTCIATTAWYFGQAGKSNPVMDGVVSSGSSTCWSRQDHVHPVDTSRLAVTTFNTYTGTTSGVYGSQYQKAQSLLASGTTSTTGVTKVTLTTTSLPAGTYKVTVSWIWNRSNASSNAEFDVLLDNVVQGTQTPLVYRINNSAEIHADSQIFYFTLTAGIHTIKFRHFGSTAGATTTTSDNVIELIRVV